MFASYHPGRVGKRELMAQLGVRSPRTLDLYVAKGLVPEGRLERPAFGRGGYRRTWSFDDLAAAAMQLACSGLPRRRRDALDGGRERARIRRLERAELRDLAARVVDVAGVEALREALRPVHGGPLREVPVGRHPLVRAALVSLLRRHGEAS